MANDDQQKIDESLDIEPSFDEALARFDESLRRGDASNDSQILHETGDRLAAKWCLTLLERAFPRSQPPSNAVLPGSIGRFELLRVLGQGGFGVVYLARDPQLDRCVALKVPRLNTIESQQWHARFLREARAVASLEHPQIIPVLETGEIGPICYIVSAYCEGGDLKDWLHKNGPVAAQMAARIIVALADAVEYSHRHGILHRDIKPSNILLALPTGTAAKNSDLPFIPRLGDFGLARVLEEPGATVSSLMGTPLYMAPEQTVGQGEGVSPATDTYALGAVLYELLVGSPPFQGANALEVMDKVRTADPISPSRLVGSIPRDLSTICLKCLAKEPARRYDSAAALQADLEAFLEGRVISARPASATEVTCKWVRRHPLTALVLSLLASAACALVFLQWRHTRELTQHLARAEQLEKQLTSSLSSYVKLTDELSSTNEAAISAQREAEAAQRQAEEREIDLLVRNSVSEINSASLDLYRGRFDLAERRIAPIRQALASGRDAVRGIEPEWNYVRRQLAHPPAERVFTEHGRPVYSVAVSPDGATVASGDDGGTIKVWELETGRVLASLNAHDGEVRALAFSPDGKRLASGGMFHFLKIWDTNTWQLLQSVDAHDGTTTCLSWQADDKFLASGGRDGKVRLWNTADLALQQEFDVGAVVHCVRTPGDGSCIWTSSQADQTSRISKWSLQGEQYIRENLFATPFDQYDFDLTADGKLAVIGCGFLTDSGRMLRTDRSPFTQAMAMSGSGRWAAQEGNGGTIQLWRWVDDPFSGVSEQHWLGHQGTVMHSFAASSDGARLITAGMDGSVKVWRIEEFTQPDRRWLVGHTSQYILGLAFSPDDRLVASASHDGFIRVYECETGKLFDSLDLSEQHHICTNTGFAADGKTLIVATGRAGIGSGLLVWRPGSGAPYQYYLRNNIIDLSFTADGTRMAMTNLVHAGIEVWDTARMEPIRVYNNLPPRPMNHVRFSPEGRTIAFTGLKSGLYLLDVETGAHRPVPELRYPLESFGFDRSGTRLAVTTEGSSEVEVIDVFSGEIINFNPGYSGNRIRSSGVVFSPDGKLLAVGRRGHDNYDGRLEIWHLETSRPILTLETYYWGAGRIRYSNTGRYLAAVNAITDWAGNSGIMLWQFDPPR